jgi:hypothetical protein
LRFVGDPRLPEGRVLQGQLQNNRLDLRRRAVSQQRLFACHLLQRQFATGLVKLLEAVKAVARIAHHLAGLADIAELLGQLQQPHLGADDLLVLGHISVLSNTEAGRYETLTTPRPASAPASADDTVCQI